MPMSFQDRRQFLARGIASLGLVSQARLLAAAEREPVSAPWRMRLSASSIAFASLPIEQATERIASLGFEAIDIWSAYKDCPHLDDAKNRLGAEGLKSLLQKHGLALNAFSVYVGGFDAYADLLRDVGGGVAITGSAPPCDPKDLSSTMKQFLENLKPIADKAGESGSTLAIENHGNALLDSVDSIKAFVDLNKHPRLGIALAPFHIQAGGESVTDAIHAAGASLLFFYAWQHDPAMSVKQLPGLGPADCRPWLEALAKVNYQGYVNPFLHDEPPPDRVTPALGQSKAYLLECYKNAIGS